MILTQGTSLAPKSYGRPWEPPRIIWKSSHDRKIGLAPSGVWDAKKRSGRRWAAGLHQSCFPSLSSIADGVLGMVVDLDHEAVGHGRTRHRHNQARLANAVRWAEMQCSAVRAL
jgi:hypothetical protein